MSQTNRQLSLNNVWSGVEKIKTGSGSRAPSMAQIAEETCVFFTQKSTANGRLADNAEPNSYGSRCTMCDMEIHCCQTAVAPQEALNADSRVGDRHSFPACATISETARELCKAVSVSLGLATESTDTGDMDATLPPCAANDHRGECLLGVGAVPLNFPGAQSVVAAEYREEFQKQPVELFKSSDGAASVQHIASTRASADERNFTLCKVDGITSEEIDHLKTVRAASCPYTQSAQINLAHFGQATERPCRVYKPPDEVKDFGEVMDRKFGGYQPEQHGVKIKSELPGPARVLWGNNYTFNEKYNTEFWGKRQCTNARSAGANGAICNPYERSVVRPEQWYPSGMLKPPYPNSCYVKTEVAYNDAR